MIAMLFAGGEQEAGVQVPAVLFEAAMENGMKLAITVDEHRGDVRWTIHHEPTNRQFSSGVLRLPEP